MEFSTMQISSPINTLVDFLPSFSFFFSLFSVFSLSFFSFFYSLSSPSSVFPFFLKNEYRKFSLCCSVSSFIVLWTYILCLLSLCFLLMSQCLILMNWRVSWSRALLHNCRPCSGLTGYLPFTAGLTNQGQYVSRAWQVLTTESAHYFRFCL